MTDKQREYAKRYRERQKALKSKAAPAELPHYDDPNAQYCTVIDSQGHETITKIED